MSHSRSLSRFLRKRRQLRRLPLWAVLLLLAWIIILAKLERHGAPESTTLPPAHVGVATVPSGRFKAHVVRVADGDTLTAQTNDGRQIKVRLARIDAPETGYGAKRPGQPFGEASTRSLRQLVGNNTVTLDCPETDRYQRHVCWVYADGVDVNLEQVKRGMAWVYRPARVPRREAKALAPLLDAQDAAKHARQGLWRDTNPIPPWDWRRECWQDGRCR